MCPPVAVARELHEELVAQDRAWALEVALAADDCVAGERMDDVE